MRAHPAAWMSARSQEGVLSGRAGRTVRIRFTRRAIRDASVVSYGRCSSWRRVAVAPVGGAAWPRRRACGCSRAPAVLVCLVFFPQERFRIPVIDPALVVLGGLGAAAMLPENLAYDPARRPADLQRAPEPREGHRGRARVTTSRACCRGRRVAGRHGRARRCARGANGRAGST